MYRLQVHTDAARGTRHPAPSPHQEVPSTRHAAPGTQDPERSTPCYSPAIPACAYLLELAAGPHAGVRSRLRHDSRADAPQTHGPFTALLEARGRGVPRL